VIAHVESVAGSLTPQFRVDAGGAAQLALVRFHEAASAQMAQLDDISSNVHTAGIHYSTTDQERAGSLTARSGDFGGNSAGVHPAAAQPATKMDFGDTFPPRDTLSTAGTAAPARMMFNDMFHTPEARARAAAIDAEADRAWRGSNTGGAHVRPVDNTTKHDEPTAPAKGRDVGQCVKDEFKDNIGKNMVKDGFKSGVETAIKGAIGGAVGGAAATPEAGGAGAIPGGIGGGVLGFVGGFGRGLLEAPLKTAAEAARDCAK
jgi:hypothetical protein